MDDNAQASSVAGQNAGQTNPSAGPQIANKPVEPPRGTQQVSISGYPEQGPVATIEMDEDDKDDRQAAKQEAPIIQPSHPEVLIARELDRAGIKPGADAVKKQLPEEPEQLGDVPVQQVTTTQIGDIELPMSYGEAKLAKRKERSIRKGISWIIREIIREWKKRLLKKSANQLIS